MVFSSVQNLRRKFERRFISLKESDYDSLQDSLIEFWEFFDDEPTLRKIKDDLTSQFPILSRKIYQVFNSPGSDANKEKASRLESIAIAAEVLYSIAKVEKNNFRKNLQISVYPTEFYPFGLTQINIDDRYAEVFKRKYFDKFFYYVGEQLDELEESEKIMRSRYEEQEYNILQTLVEKGVYNYTHDKELMELLPISKEDLYVILADFRTKGWVGLIAGGSVQLLAPGVTAFHKWESINVSNSNQNSGNTYNNAFHSPVVGIQQGGQNNTQNIIQNVNPDFAKAINDLLNLVEHSSLGSVHKIHMKADVQIIKDLADLEKSSEVLQLANSRIEAVKEVISMTADMTSLGMVLIPILQAVFSR